VSLIVQIVHLFAGDMPALMNIRPARAADLPLLSEYWYDRAALLQQMGAPLKLLPDARSHWEAAAATWLHADDTYFLTCVINNEAGGALVGRIEANQPGLAPERYGRVLQLIIDLHTPQFQQGMGGALLRAFQARLRDNDITRLIAAASVALAVEEAFWRGMGAHRTQTIFWMDV
jgi:RimJ/RimL family protein N-acetyltransferase